MSGRELSSGIGGAQHTLHGRGVAREYVRRVSLSQITTLGWSFERDVAFYASVGVRSIGVSIRKLDAIGVVRAGQLIRDAGLTVSCLTSSGMFPL
ncbi:MAG: hypothetical protein ACREQL_01460, partial [Candidatus Binatia bacterium]